jgi:hypothetical protein
MVEDFIAELCGVLIVPFSARVYGLDDLVVGEGGVAIELGVLIGLHLSVFQITFEVLA